MGAGGHWRGSAAGVAHGLLCERVWGGVGWDGMGWDGRWGGSCLHAWWSGPEARASMWLITGELRLPCRSEPDPPHWCLVE